MKIQFMRDLLFLWTILVISFTGCGRTDVSVPAKPGETGEYYKVWAKRLLIRDAPDMKGKVIGSLEKNEKVLVIGKTGKSVQIDGAYGQWLKVKKKDNLTGYAFGGFMTEFVDYSLNRSPFSILGTWHRYMDPPNESFYFYADNTCMVASIGGYDEPLVKKPGTYTYDGRSAIRITFKDGTTHGMQVVTIGERTTLMDRPGDRAEFFFDEEQLFVPLKNRSK